GGPHAVRGVQQDVPTGGGHRVQGDDGRRRQVARPRRIPAPALLRRLLRRRLRGVDSSGLDDQQHGGEGLAAQQGPPRLRRHRLHQGEARGGLPRRRLLRRRPRPRCARLRANWNETFEKLGTIGTLSNMLVYLTTVYHMQSVSAATLLNVFSGTSNLATVLGAFVSDTYL
uniref:Uncharacterized protein n=1 Tax=Aegilops tauschii subsp. strangulata TaxID=200361 RepID=A0A453QKJ3_AEGTS